jgi:flagellar hook-length control protein FliK
MSNAVIPFAANNKLPTQDSVKATRQSSERTEFAKQEPSDTDKPQRTNRQTKEGNSKEPFKKLMEDVSGKSHIARQSNAKESLGAELHDENSEFTLATIDSNESLASLNTQDFITENIGIELAPNSGHSELSIGFSDEPSEVILAATSQLPTDPVMNAKSTLSTESAVGELQVLVINSEAFVDSSAEARLFNQAPIPVGSLADGNELTGAVQFVGVTKGATLSGKIAGDSPAFKDMIGKSPEAEFSSNSNSSEIKSNSIPKLINGSPSSIIESLQVSNEVNAVVVKAELSPSSSKKITENLLAKNYSGASPSFIAAQQATQVAKQNSTELANIELDNNFSDSLEMAKLSKEESISQHESQIQSPAKAYQASTDRVLMSANIRFGMPGWADQVAQRSASLASQNIKQAEIHLNPKDLGPINVKISVANDQAAITFTVQNASVREALDLSLQRLRDAFEGEGMNLVQADVRDQPHSQREENAESAGGFGVADHEQENLENMISTMSLSLVDHFV